MSKTGIIVGSIIGGFVGIGRLGYFLMPTSSPIPDYYHVYNFNGEQLYLIANIPFFPNYYTFNGDYIILEQEITFKDNLTNIDYNLNRLKVSDIQHVFLHENLVFTYKMLEQKDKEEYILKFFSKQ